MTRLLQAVTLCTLTVDVSCHQPSPPADKPDIHMNAITGAQPRQSGATAKLPAYELHGIIDPGINNMIAFAVQTPAGWKVQQSFTRVWNRSTPITQVYVRATSPDGGQVLEYLPSSSYFFTDGPMARNMRQMAASYGQAMPRTPGELSPMPALEYIRRVLIPQLTQRGLRVQVTGQKVLPGNQNQNLTVSNAYVDGTMGNGRKVRIDCIVNLTTTKLNSEIYYNWEALPSVTQSGGNIDATYAFTTHGRKSIIVNPSWLKQNQQLVTNGNIANAEIDRKNAAIQKDYHDYTNKIINETYEEHSKSMDRTSEASSDVIRGEAKFENSETGERVKLSDQYNHIYQDRQGNYYGSNTTVDAGQFDWQELQRVETKNY